jgi:hypothetical protein
MSATKSFLLMLLIVAFAPVADTHTLPLTALSSSKIALASAAPMSAAWFAVPQSHTLGSTVHSPDKWSLLLLSLALVAYQLGRNQRSLNRQLTNR